MLHHHVHHVQDKDGRTALGIVEVETCSFIKV